MFLRKAKIKNKSPAMEERLRDPIRYLSNNYRKKNLEKGAESEESLLFLNSALFWNSSKGFGWQFPKTIFKNPLKIFYSFYKNIYIEILELIPLLKPIIMSPYEELVIAIKINQGIAI